jgi:hypothetical protein
MKVIKRMLTSALCLSLLLSGMTLHVFAAEGSIAFSDPETAVGDMVEVKCAVDSTDDDTVGSVELTLSYDSEALRFDSGDGVTKSSDGTLVYSGQGSSEELKFTMNFQALKEGETQITVSSATVSTSSGEAVTLEYGSSTITIAEGDESKITEDTEATGSGITVQVNGVDYELASTFADGDVPAGYEKTTVEYQGAECAMAVNSTSNVYLAYLISSSGEGDFFLYDEDNAAFLPYEQINISDSSWIIILSDDSLSVPSTYEQTTLTLNGKDFPIWQDSEDREYYVVYALNSSGDKCFYRYDSQDETYQRCDLAEEEKSEEKSSGSSVFGKIQNVVDRYFAPLIILVGVIFVILLIVLIVTKVKLRHRDLELDDLYDEYGIDLDEEEEKEVPVKAKKSTDKPKDKLAVRKPQKTAEINLEEDFDDYGELDYEDDYEDEDDFEDFDDFEDDYEDDYEEDDYEDEDDIIDDLDELLSEQPKKRSHQEEDDTFKVDFVDLD